MGWKKFWGNMNGIVLPGKLAGKMHSEKAQVSLEYLLIVLFGVLLAVSAAAMALNLIGVANTAKTKILSYREAMVDYLMN